MNEQITTWDARQLYTQFILQLIQDMYEDKRNKNILGYKTAYEQLLIITEFYIAKHLKNNDLNIDKVDELMDNIVPENTDHEIKLNDRIYSEIFGYLKEKERLLLRFLAMEKLLLPMTDKFDIGEAILQTR